MNIKGKLLKTYFKYKKIKLKVPASKPRQWIGYDKGYM